MTTDRSTCKQAAIRAVKWLIRQQNDDGSFQPLAEGMAGFHKVPYALALSGQSGRGVRLCTWIVDNSMDEDGDLGASFGRQGSLERYYAYGPAWIIAGAQKLGQFGVSIRAWAFLSSLQHPDTGGFLRDGPEAGLDDEEDALGTAAAGLAALYMGDERVARAAADFLVRRWEQIPQTGERMYLMVRRGEEPVRVYGEGLDAEYVLQLTEPGQWYFVPGLVAGFLTKIGEAIEERSYTQVAQEFVDLCESGAEDRYTSPRSGFFGWAASRLFLVTGNVNYRRIAEAVLEALVERQNPDGSWLEPQLPSDLVSAQTDATAEALILILETLDNLEAGAE
ncbi:MAG: prenyltransferase/squalene oxidase repeat-containing protein [Armatimonadota bacterium]|nr:prenyltransferase/squalene oxidase repeat-containing protein [Armatimonadota bacterium]